MKKYKLLKSLLIIGLGVVFGPRVFTTINTYQDIYLIDDIPQRATVVVFGAALRRDGEPSAALRVRVEASVDLYNEGKINTLIMSGADPEPEAMKELAIALGVPAENILIDNDGLRSYDTCASAKYNFGIESVILVTQSYHLPRSIHLCNAMGVESIGFAATEVRYWRGAMVVWNIRETLATGKAMWDLYVSPPELDFVP